MKKSISKEFMAILCAILVLLSLVNMNTAFAEDYIEGNGRSSISFYVKSYGNASITFQQNKGTCTELSYTKIISGITGTAEEWGKYHIYYTINGYSYSTDWNNTYGNETFRLDLDKAGDYMIEVIPYTDSEMTSSYVADVFLSWEDAPDWWISRRINCECYQNRQKDGEKKYETFEFGEVTVFIYKDGVYAGSYNERITENDYVRPIQISGYTCISDSVYISFERMTGYCYPNIVSFYYITIQPSNNDNWAGSSTESGYSYGNNDTYDNDTYVVESFQPNGYCYLYDQPSDVYGQNLGRHENGELVTVIEYDARNGGYYRVICSNGKVGYIHEYALRPVYQKRAGYEVYSTQPMGYCYLYDQPSDIYGQNLGRYNNGEGIDVIDWWASDAYAKVYCIRTGQVGYMHKTCLIESH